MDDAAGLQQVLVDGLQRTGALRDQGVEAAFRAVPRHLFLPDTPLEEVYGDQAIVTKRIDAVGVSSSSQPSVMAIMLEQLAAQPGHRVLEIGAGTGYNAALLAHVVGAAGKVVTIDIDADIARAAQQHLISAGLEGVEVICGDGGLGYPLGAPYDRIIVTVGAWDITPAWWEQLCVGGRLVVPLALRGPEIQRAIAFDRMDDHLASDSVRPCGFMLLRGAFAGPTQQVALGAAGGLRLVHEHAAAVDADAVFGWLGAPGASVATGVCANTLDVAGGLNLWLALHDVRLCALVAEGNTADSERVPPLYGGGQMRSTVGLLGERGLALLGWIREQTPTAEGNGWSPEAPASQLAVRSFGVDPGITQALLSHVVGWDTAGRPGGDHLRVRAYRRGVQPAASTAVQVVEKQWTSLMLEWT
jgi:protein-L-isoaspartate(D-aspartate) O-methyltransferase